MRIVMLLIKLVYMKISTCPKALKCSLRMFLSSQILILSEKTSRYSNMCLKTGAANIEQCSLSLFQRHHAILNKSILYQTTTVCHSIQLEHVTKGNPCTKDKLAKKLLWPCSACDMSIAKLYKGNKAFQVLQSQNLQSLLLHKYTVSEAILHHYYSLIKLKFI